MDINHHLANFPISPGIKLIDTGTMPHRVYQYNEIDTLINAVANGLLHLQLPVNSRIATISQNSVDYVTFIGGIYRARHCHVPINFKIPQEQINFCFEDAGIAVAFCDSQLRHLVPAGVPCIEFKTKEYEDFLNYDCYKIPPLDPNGEITVMYTSGTTNKPKGVISLYKNRIWSLTSGSPKNNIEAQLYPLVRCISVSPYYHLAGLNDIEGSLYYSRHFDYTHIIMPKFDAKEYLKLCSEYKVTMLRMVAPMMGMLLQEKELLETLNFESVSRICLTSSSAPKKMQDDAMVYFKNTTVIENPYGLTETGPVFMQQHPYGIPKPQTSVGFPTPGVKLRIDENGVLQIKSPVVMAGYHNRKDLRVFTDDGYFITGDLFRVNKYGFYFYIGRADDMFKSGGEKIYPSEIEETIEQHPAVSMSCVVGVPDDIKGHKPYAFVQLKPGMTAVGEEIKQFTIKRVATYQIPRSVWVLDSLPRTNIGKIDRRGLTGMAKDMLLNHEQ
jgi:acyl-CoA synthetase (AMP-forming)/AMP-acid ligase II